MSGKAKKIKVARTGTFTDARGTTVTFTQDFFEGMAKSYDPTVRQSPLVKGHPALDDPAYGWVKEVHSEGDDLYVLAEQIDPGFEQEVRAGRFKHVSAEIYLPNAKANPNKEGLPYLKHVGVLGAAQPAIDSLGAVSFASASAGLSGWMVSDWGRSLVKLVSFLKGLGGSENQDSDVLNEVESLGFAMVERGASLSTEQKNAEPVSFAEENDDKPEGENMSGKQDKESRDEDPQNGTDSQDRDLEAERAELEQERVSLAEERKALRQEKFQTRTKGLVESGRLLPAQEALVVSLAEALPEGTTEVISFAEGDETKSLPPTEALFSLLESLPEQVSFAEASGGGDGAAADADDPEALARAATAYQKDQAGKGQTVSMADAVLAVSEGEPS